MEPAESLSEEAPQVIEKTGKATLTVNRVRLENRMQKIQKRKRSARKAQITGALDIYKNKHARLLDASQPPSLARGNQAIRAL